MAHPEGFTGNPDMDVHILFSLPDQELRRLCSANKYLRALCSSPDNQARWQERYQQHFPYVPPVMQGSWYATYWYTVGNQQLSTYQLNQLLESTRVYGPCLVSYLRRLARQLFHLLATTPPDVFQMRLDSYRGREAHILRVNASPLLNSTHAGIVEGILHFLLEASSQGLLSPWALNDAIVNDEFLHRALPEVGETLPITINVRGQTGIHELDELPFLGMMLYTIYVAPGQVTFYLGDCPLQYSAGEIEDLLSAFFITGDTQPGKIIMRNGDTFVISSVREFMQGFITVARWLGQNYRLGYYATQLL